MYWEPWEADFLISIYYVPPKPEEEPAIKQKDLTKAEIIKGYKVGILSSSDAISALMSIGYEDWEASFLIAINTKFPEGSPQTLSEYERLVQEWRKSAGLSYVEVPDDLTELEKEVQRTKLDIEHLKRVKASDEDIAKLAVKLADLELRLKLRYQQFTQSRK